MGLVTLVLVVLNHSFAIYPLDWPLRQTAIAQQHPTYVVLSEFVPKKAALAAGFVQTQAFSFFRLFWSQTGPRDPSGCVGIAEISLGARSKCDLVACLSKNLTFRPNLGLQALLIRFPGL